MNKVIMHINYGEITYDSYGKKTIDDICRQAAEIGYDGIEFRGRPPKELEALSFGEYATQIAAAKKKYGLSEILFSIGLSECTNDDKEVRAKCIAEAVEKAQIANDLCGTTLSNSFAAISRSSISTAPGTSYEFHGSASATQKDWDLTVESFQIFGKELEKIGLKVGFETHMNYIHDLPAPAKKLVDLIGSPMIGINMDYGNTVYFPVRPSVEETIDIYGDKLFYTHLKNSSAIPGSTFRMATNLCDGDINHRGYYQKLKEVGFAGPIGIEAPRGGDRVWFAQQDYNYFKSIMETL